MLRFDIVQQTSGVQLAKILSGDGTVCNPVGNDRRGAIPVEQNAGEPNSVGDVDVREVESSLHVLTSVRSMTAPLGGHNGQRRILRRDGARQDWQIVGLRPLLRGRGSMVPQH